MRKKIVKKTLLVVLITVITLSLAACGDSSQKQADNSESLPDEINFGILRVPNDETIAMVEGYFDDYFTDRGIEVNFTVFDSGSEANQALASDSIDFATMGNINSITALSRDLGVELIWIHEILGEIEALAVREDSGINEINDLAGKRVAVPFASTCHYVLLNAIKEAGISEEVELLDMRTSEIVAAWQRGDIDAAYTWQPSLGKLYEDNGVPLITSEEMAERGYVTANVDVVKKDFADKYPELVTDFVTLLAKAGDIYRNDPEKGAEIVSQKLSITADEALNQMQGSTWHTREKLLSERFFGSSDNPGEFAKIMKETSDFLLEQDSLDHSPSQEEFHEYVNPEFIEKSLEQTEGN
ncbi:MAG: ABC transporter substrate-binding protein [Halanaerobiales bacterium]